MNKMSATIRSPVAGSETLVTVSSILSTGNVTDNKFSSSQCPVVVKMMF